LFTVSIAVGVPTRTFVIVHDAAWPTAIMTDPSAAQSPPILDV
jgi:hypothetical protein